MKFTYRFPAVRGIQAGREDYISMVPLRILPKLFPAEDERLDLAFGEKTDFNKLAYLTQFANYGVLVLNAQVGDSVIETMENIKNFLFSTVEGRNLDIDALPDDILLTD